jgi:hypothetical protein
MNRFHCQKYSAAGRVLAPGKKALKGAPVHLIKQIQPGIVFAVIDLGQPIIAIIVFGGGGFAKKRFEHTD